MTATIDQARDQTFALFTAAWNADAAQLVGYIPEVRYQGREKATKPHNSRFWCRISFNAGIEQQGSLSSCVGAPGHKRYNSAGNVFVQVFAPRQLANGDALGLELAKVARNAFRGKRTTPGDVWFRNVRINTLSPEESAWRFNVIAEYMFDEIG